MPKYRVITPGQVVSCAVCGVVFQGGNCRNLASACYDSHQTAPEPPRPLLPYQRHGPWELPADNTVHPDEHGHRSRVNPALNRENRRRWLAANYHKAQAFLERLGARPPEIWKEKISPLQRLAFAFHYGRWESVKQAAEAYAFDRAIERKVEEMNIPAIIEHEIWLRRKIQEAKTMLSGLLADSDMQRATQIIDTLRLDDYLAYVEETGDAAGPPENTDENENGDELYGDSPPDTGDNEEP
jgi:hypothetical protein